MTHADYLDELADELEPGPPTDATKLLPTALLTSVLGAAGLRELEVRLSYCAIVQAPSSDWVNPISRSLRSIGEWDYYTSQSTPVKSPKQHDDVSQYVVGTLARGGRVFGVSQQPNELLPPSIIVAADRRIKLPLPSCEVIASVIQAVTGSCPIDVPADLVAGLDFNEIVSCIRHNSSAAECVDRLKQTKARKIAVVRSDDTVPHVHELHGLGAAKNFAMDLVADIEAFRRGELAFNDIVSSAILTGKSGTGKTSLVRSLAKSANLPLISTSVGEWFATSNGYLDGVIKKIDETFAAARAVAPAIVLLDEIDAVPSRSSLNPRNRDWWLPVITHLLTTLDGAISSKTENLIVIGATNYPQLDEALIRPGRFSRIIEIGLPDHDALSGILRQHLGKDLEETDLTNAAHLAAGATGAIVQEWVKAARRTARVSKRAMVLADLLQQIAPADNRSPELIWRIAVHEAGHAVASHLLGLGELLAISIASSGNTGGYTEIAHDGRVPTRREAERLVIQLLAGRCAEELILGEPSTGGGGGVNSDLAQSTDLLGLLHLGAGLGDSLLYRAGPGHIVSGLVNNPGIAKAVENDLRRLYSSALSLIKGELRLVEVVAENLVRHRHVSGERFLELAASLKEAEVHSENPHG